MQSNVTLNEWKYVLYFKSRSSGLCHHVALWFPEDLDLYHHQCESLRTCTCFLLWQLG